MMYHTIRAQPKMRNPQDALRYIVVLVSAYLPGKLLASFVAVSLAYLFPGPVTASLAVWAFALVMQDMITGIAASRKSGHAIQSAKVGRTGSKLVGYGSLVMIAIFIGRNTPGLANANATVDLPAVGESGVLAFICYQEIVSILENLKTMDINIGPFAKFITPKPPATPASIEPPNPSV